MKSFLILLICAISSIGLQAQNESFPYAYRWKNQVLSSEAPRIEGQIYRVDLLTVRHFNPNDPDLRSLKKFGNLYPEKNLKKGVIYLMLGDYKTTDEANQVLVKVKNMGFTNASLVKYQDGYRQE